MKRIYVLNSIVVDNQVIYYSNNKRFTQIGYNYVIRFAKFPNTKYTGKLIQWVRNGEVYKEFNSEKPL